MITWNIPYEQYIVYLMRKSYALCEYTDSEIIAALKKCLEIYQFCPGDDRPIRHHYPNDEPTDYWFLSRIFDELTHPSLCNKGLNNEFQD